MEIEAKHEIVAKIQTSLDRLDVAIQATKPIAVYGLFSGGHDSFSACYVASKHPAFSGCLHINTGIGVPATREYVRETCSHRRWHLIEMKAADNTNSKGESDPQIYEDMVMKHGFPGPAGHGFMYVRLKERALRRFERSLGASAVGKIKKRVLYVSGCRQQESERRMGNTTELQIHGRQIWCAAILDWSKLDTTHCLQFADQNRNPVVDLLHKSGECLCGAFAKPNELEELNLWEITRPAYDQIKQIEARVFALHPWKWGTRPPRKVQHCSMTPEQMHLCWSCQK